MWILANSNKQLCFHDADSLVSGPKPKSTTNQVDLHLHKVKQLISKPRLLVLVGVVIWRNKHILLFSQLPFKHHIGPKKLTQRPRSLTWGIDTSLSAQCCLGETSGYAIVRSSFFNEGSACIPPDEGRCLSRWTIFLIWNTKLFKRPIWVKFLISLWRMWQP